MLGAVIVLLGITTVETTCIMFMLAVIVSDKYGNSKK